MQKNNDLSMQFRGGKKERGASFGLLKIALEIVIDYSDETGKNIRSNLRINVAAILLISC